MRYAIVIEKAESNFSGYVPDLPGCVATGATVEETENELLLAIQFHLDGLREDGLAPPAAESIVEYMFIPAQPFASLSSNVMFHLLRRASLAAAAALLLGGCADRTMPKDPELIANFHRDKADLSRLVEMLREDASLRRVSISYPPSPEKAIDEPRLRDYRNLMSRTRIGSIFASRGKGGAALPKDQTVKFSSEYGLSLSQSKGYFYSEVEPRPLRESLDLTENDARVPPYQSHYKRIDGNWYLYLESLSD